MEIYFMIWGVMTKNTTEKITCVLRNHCSVPEAFRSCLFVTCWLPQVAVLAPPLLSNLYPSPPSLLLCAAKSGSNLALLVGVTVSLPL